MGWVADFKTGIVIDTDIKPTVKLSVLEPGKRPATGKPRPATKFKWEHVRSRLAVGRERALKIAGSDVRRATQRAMSNRKPIKEKLIDLGVVDGERLVAKRRQIAIPDKVTSWKTARFPKGFLRSDIQYDYDATTDSVVVGPTRLPKLNKLHEVGGQVQLWFVRTRAPASVPRRLSGGAVFGITSNTPAGTNPIELGSRRVRARRYMQTGLDDAKPNLAEAFRDAISGP
jgi:hypothetical protein